MDRFSDYSIYHLKSEIMKIDSEYMGIFGLTWEEKVADLTYKKVANIDKNIAKKLKDFWQAGGLNVTLIKNLHREYIALQAQNYKPANFENGFISQETSNLSTILSNRLNIEKIITDSFLRSLYELSSQGKIPFEKWNPSGYKSSIELQKTFETEKNIFEKLSENTKSTKNIIVLLGIVTGLFYINKLTGFFNEKKN